VSKSGDNTPEGSKKLLIKPVKSKEGLTAREAFLTNEEGGSYAKVVHETTWNSTLCISKAPKRDKNGKLPLFTDQQIKDQLLLCQKTQLAGALASIIMGPGNAAKTRVATHENRFGQKISIIDSPFIEGRDLDECTSAKKQPYTPEQYDKIVKERINSGVDADNAALSVVNERKTMGTYFANDKDRIGTPITSYATIGEKEIRGFGNYAAMSQFLGNNDAHPGNPLINPVVINDTVDHYQVKAIDYKFYLSASEQFERPFFESEIETNVQKFKDDNNIDGQINTHQNYINSTLDFIKREKNKDPLFDSQNDEDEIADSQSEINNLKNEVKKKESFFPDLSKPGNLSTMLESVFPSKSTTNEIDIDGDYIQQTGENFNVFKFPFPKGFGNAKHVQEKYLDSVYKIINLNPDYIQLLVNTAISHDHMTPSNIPAQVLLTQQLVMNQDKFKSAFEVCPEYIQHVDKNKQDLAEQNVAAFKCMDAEIEYIKKSSNEKITTAPYLKHDLVNEEKKKNLNNQKNEDKSPILIRKSSQETPARRRASEGISRSPQSHNSSRKVKISAQSEEAAKYSPAARRASSAPKGKWQNKVDEQRKETKGKGDQAPSK
jgi:hypothetical protein